MSRTFIACVVLWHACLFAGCSRNRYEVKLKPTADGMQRTVVVGSHSGPRDENGKPAFVHNEEVARLESIYGSHSISKSGKEASFPSKVFSNQMPQDVGGSGRFMRFTSPLGTAAAYVERFRGNDDLYAQLKARGEVVDQFVDLVAGWFEAELQNEPGWPALEKFFHESLRRDLQNFSLYSLSIEMLPDDESMHRESAMLECFLRGVQYLVERGYGTYEEIPSMMRSHDIAPDEDADRAFHQLRDVLAVKLRAIAPAISPEKMSFFLDSSKVIASWRKYFDGTPYFQREKAKRLAADEKEIAAIRGSSEISPEERAREEADVLKKRETMHEEVFAALWSAAFNPLPHGSGFDALTVSLAAEAAPEITNGKWKSDEKHVVWETSVDVPEGERGSTINTPAFIFAIWDEPNVDAQKRLFGGSALKGMSLVNYCIWYATLKAAEKQQWDAFVVTLKSDDDSRAKLEAFHFADEPAPTDARPTVAKRGLDMMRQALKLEKTKE